LLSFADSRAKAKKKPGQIEKTYNPQALFQNGSNSPYVNGCLRENIISKLLDRNWLKKINSEHKSEHIENGGDSSDALDDSGYQIVKKNSTYGTLFS